MKFNPPLQKGKLIKRYKRFLADVQLDENCVITAHCPNTGSMKNCIVESSNCWLSKSDNPKRKYAYTLEVVTAPRRKKAGVNTGRANALVQEAIESGAIKALRGYANLRREVKYGRENSRIDFLLEQPMGKQTAPCYVEVKNVTLEEEAGCGYFPDSVSERGQKHLRELIEQKKIGCRAVLLFCVQHSGIDVVYPADHIDPVYGDTLREAAKAGVEILAYKAKLTAKEIALQQKIPVKLRK